MAIEGAIHNDNACSAVLDRFALGLKGCGQIRHARNFLMRK